jgi:hypothetical protein
MTEEQPRILELQKQLRAELEEKFGISGFSEFGNCQCGDKIKYGKHITLVFPTHVKVVNKEIEELFAKYYGVVKFHHKDPIVSHGFVKTFQHLTFLIEEAE